MLMLDLLGQFTMMVMRTMLYFGANKNSNVLAWKMNKEQSNILMLVSSLLKRNNEKLRKRRNLSPESHHLLPQLVCTDRPHPQDLPISVKSERFKKLSSMPKLMPQARLKRRRGELRRSVWLQKPHGRRRRRKNANERS